MRTIEVTNFEEATHWMPINDENIEFANLTENKMYEIILDKAEYERVIIDNKGFMSLAYLAVNGKLFKVIK